MCYINCVDAPNPIIPNHSSDPTKHWSSNNFTNITGITDTLYIEPVCKVFVWLETEHSAFFRTINRLERKLSETETRKPFFYCFLVWEQERPQGSKELFVMNFIWEGSGGNLINRGRGGGSKEEQQPFGIQWQAERQWPQTEIWNTGNSI